MKNFASLLFKLSIVAMLTIFAFVKPVYALERVPFSYADECTTESTDFDGARHTCSSDWSSHPVPSGYVYVKDSLKPRYASANGSENSCNVVWENEVEVVPGTGIKLPRVLKTQAYARSPKGSLAELPGRGWSKCIYEGYYTQLP